MYKLYYNANNVSIEIWILGLWQKTVLQYHNMVCSELSETVDGRGQHCTCNYCIKTFPSGLSC